ncbi:hypothetical protein [Candidatus Kuenenia stuttgartiensis]|uniref:hypothetical protein n=1 Tax=Kuenenia stuttgartiensis TaxID=174633 RepID=UPI00146D2B2D|nr:hypothetical protein [Candidatus Kuenenia stuttgartiensis]
MIYSANGEYLGSGNLYLRDQALKLQPPHLQNQNIITSTLSLRTQIHSPGSGQRHCITTKSSPNDPGHSWHSSRKLALLMDTKALSPPSALMNSNPLKKCYNRIRSQRIIAHGGISKMPP